MGFFKNIGKAVGGFVKKNVNFKNLVKTVGTGASFIPGVGGVVGGFIQNAQAQHEAKKEEQLYNQQLAQEQAAYDAQMASQVTNYPVVTPRPMSPYAMAKTNPTFMDILQGAGGGALQGAGGVLAGSNTAGNIGATVVDNSLMTLIRQNGLKYLGILLGVVLVVVGLVKFVFKPKNKRKW